MITYFTILSMIITVREFNGSTIQRVPTAHNDLVTLARICEGHDHTHFVNITELLGEFKKSTGLRVSNSDLLTYFSNLGVRFYVETC